ncbi:MAG: aspartate aminotransferase family protein [Candidatus Tectimicrobiota bacterium]|nr:MAG: aspartate aminotransferase family protein [Candidatus Tectomicrobia bacterium]
MALSAAKTQADLAHLIHPLYHPSEHQEPRIWVEGRGAMLKDIDGNEVIDGLSGLWNVNIGHGRRELAEAARRQMETLAYCSSYTGSSNLPAIELAERLSTLVYPSINTFFFTSGGAESTESSIKTARFYWKTQGKPDKVKIISRTFAYHGVTLAAMSATGMPEYWTMFEPRVPNFVHIPSPYPYRFEGGDGRTSPGIAAANLLEEAILREGPETVAAFIAEPVQGAGGVIVPPDDYFPRIREICDKYEVLLISDEVITGFGRTGTWFGLEHWGIEPDIMQFAKGITSGYVPLGGIGVSDTIKQAFATTPPEKRWMHAYTYSGHPTCCAVALANLKILEEEGLVQRAAEMGNRLLEGLRTLESLDGVGDVRGLGMMAAVEIVQDKASKQPYPAAAKVGARLHKEMLNRGLFTRVRGDVICLAPPLVTPPEIIDRIVNIVGEAIRTVIASTP